MNDNGKYTGKPPLFAEMLLKIFLRNGFKKQRLEEFLEIFEYIAENEGIDNAKLWYRRHTVKSIPKLIYDSIYWGAAMFKNYLTTAFRNIKKSKVYSFINIFGLAIGMTCSILILVFVADELNYDTYHENSENIYRLTNFGGLPMSGLLGIMIKEELSEVRDYTRIYAPKIYAGDILVSHEDKRFYIENFFMADPSIFKLFTFDFIRGNPETVFSNPESILITEEIASKYFGEENPIGQVLSYENKYNYTVTGVIKKLPHNSHFYVDCIIPLENYITINNSPQGLESFGNWAFLTYFLIAPNSNIEKITNKINELVYERTDGNFESNATLQSLTEIHLTSKMRDELEVNGDINSVYAFIVIAVLILLIASANFVNLTTARSTKRAKEVGIRKVVGADRKMLIKQFLTESVLMSLSALFIGLLFVFILLPYFNEISGKQFAFATFISPGMLLLFLSGALLIGISAGSFPAFIISSFKPASVLKLKFMSSGKSRFSFRNVLVLTQFSIAICLIICTAVIFNQMEFIRNADLGLDKSKMVVLPIGRDSIAISKVNVLKNELEKINEVQYATASSRSPGHRPWGRGIRILENENPPKKFLTIYCLWVDHNFIETYKINMIAGRSFSKEYTTDATSAFVINESALKLLGWNIPQEAVGKLVSCDGKEGQIIGVTKDYHFLSLHSEIMPIIMHINTDALFTVSAKVNTADMRQTLSDLKNTWDNIMPNRPFQYNFLDDDLNRQYNADLNTGKLITYFSLLSLFITCLGLLGLASYAAEQKRKEIGIRKVYGASTNTILKLLVIRFIGLTLLGNIFAWPLAYYAMTEWLQNFAYRISISVWPFIISAGIAVLIALASVSYQSLKAALANPVDSIKYE
ncbi:ABC transporter permease [Bacteroidota bacterium]